MKPERILEEQRITVKRGRMNGLGFEPAFNSFFDFYASTRYADPPLLQLEDVAFFLYLRKNLNDSNPDWKMPSFKQMKTKFGIGQGKIEAMMRRLHHARLLIKVSGKRHDGPNVTNEYILSDPISTLEEFLIVLDTGLFDPIPEMGIGGIPETGIGDVPEMGIGAIPKTGRDQQTSLQQTSDEQGDDLMTTAWVNVLGLLKQHMPFETFRVFLEGAQLIIIESNTATIRLPNPKAVDWLTVQMTKPICRFLTVEMGEKISEIRFVG